MYFVYFGVFPINLLNLLGQESIYLSDLCLCVRHELRHNNLLLEVWTLRWRKWNWHYRLWWYRLLYYCIFSLKSTRYGRLDSRLDDGVWYLSNRGYLMSNISWDNIRLNIDNNRSAHNLWFSNCNWLNIVNFSILAFIWSRCSKSCCTVWGRSASHWSPILFDCLYIRCWINYICYLLYVYYWLHYNWQNITASCHLSFGTNSIRWNRYRCR